MLKTDFKNYVAPNGKKFKITENGDDTVSIEDVTDYTVEGAVKGDSYGATEINTANEQVNVNEQAIADEVSRATNAETKLQEAIDESDDSIEDEVTRAKKAEQEITDNLTAEVTRATKAENNLDTSVKAETERATQAEKTLNDNLTAETNRATKKETEINDALTTEISDRKKADTDLQEQIDAINSRSDVVDVVATKADLDAYDKDITVDDIVKVLADETHDNATSYYRNTATAKPYVWVFIGSLGPYYTQAQTKELIDAEATLRSTADSNLDDKIEAETSRATGVEATKVNTSDIVNNLTSTSTDKPLSANQGRVLKEAIDNCYTKAQIDDLLANLLEINN